MVCMINIKKNTWKPPKERLQSSSGFTSFHIISHHFPNDPIIAEVVASVAEGAVAPMVYELSPVALKI